MSDGSHEALHFYPVVEEPGFFRKTLDRWRGRSIMYGIDSYLPRIKAVRMQESHLQSQTDAALQAQAQKWREAIALGTPPDTMLCDIYALLREVAHRTLHMRPYDVQIGGAIALYEGKLVEMATGEGKTLVAVFPAILHALQNKGVHVLTFNDYLAQRDATWMAPIYQWMGLRVAYITSQSTRNERRDAYQADVTYLTAKEAGFDYLRDGLVMTPEDRVHRIFHTDPHANAYAESRTVSHTDPDVNAHADFYCAIVDEADSNLIDEARIPLVIAGHREAQALNSSQIAAWIHNLEPGLHYETDENQRNVVLTEAGLHAMEPLTGCGNLHALENRLWLTEINLALHAKVLLQRDVDYIVRDGGIALVDEFTGRVVQDRQWPDGLQAALEAKEGLTPGQDGEILGSITLQHFLQQYKHLAGMTATVRPEDEEFKEFYQLDTVVLPPHRPCIREDLPDRVFSHKAAKNQAILKAIVQAHQQQRPVLVGTSSVRESEELAHQLRLQGMDCEVLNAKHDALEAKIVAKAGMSGAITISTNMAGRGTDIRLGGPDEKQRDDVLKAGGLYVIGTNRHETRRIDRQLRGRAGRQGDPGTSEFFVSLEDDIIQRYGVDKLLKERMKKNQEQEITNHLLQQRITWAQSVIESQNYSIRQTLWNYSWIIEQQRRWMRTYRDEMLESRYHLDAWDTAHPERYEQLVKLCGREQAQTLERQVTLFCIDRLWVEHLAMLATLREGIHIVRMGALDPYHEFRKAAFLAYETWESRVDEEILRVFTEMDLSAEGLLSMQKHIQGPSSTWTYLLDDNPFRLALGLHVARSLTLSLGAALYAPLYILVALYHRIFGKNKTP